MSTVKHVVLTTCAVILALILASTETLAETLNERIIKSIADKAAFDRVFYTTMQTVIDSNPKMGFSAPGAENPAVIRTNCNIGDNGDTYCRTSYELYDGTDRLEASLDFHSSGKIEKSLTAGTGDLIGGTRFLLDEDGGLLFYDSGKGYVKSFREHW